MKDKREDQVRRISQVRVCARKLLRADLRRKTKEITQKMTSIKKEGRMLSNSTCMSQRVIYKVIIK